MLLTDGQAGRQTDRQTNQSYGKHNLLAGDNNDHRRYFIFFTLPDLTSYQGLITNITCNLPYHHLVINAANITMFIDNTMIGARYITPVSQLGIIKVYFQILHLDYTSRVRYTNTSSWKISVFSSAMIQWQWCYCLKLVQPLSTQKWWVPDGMV